jgi:hypothetical protein
MPFAVCTRYLRPNLTNLTVSGDPVICKSVKALRFSSSNWSAVDLVK